MSMKELLTSGRQGGKTYALLRGIKVLLETEPDYPTNRVYCKDIPSARDFAAKAKAFGLTAKIKVQIAKGIWPRVFNKSRRFVYVELSRGKED